MANNHGGLTALDISFSYAYGYKQNKLTSDNLKRTGHFHIPQIEDNQWNVEETRSKQLAWVERDGAPRTIAAVLSSFMTTVSFRNSYGQRVPSGTAASR